MVSRVKGGSVHINGRDGKLTDQTDVMDRRREHFHKGCLRRKRGQSNGDLSEARMMT